MLFFYKTAYICAALLVLMMFEAFPNVLLFLTNMYATITISELHSLGAL
jgi:hypothetical protein